jgi:hypothetical protein
VGGVTALHAITTQYALVVVIQPITIPIIVPHIGGGLIVLEIVPSPQPPQESWQSSLWHGAMLPRMWMMAAPRFVKIQFLSLGVRWLLS